MKIKKIALMSKVPFIWLTYLYFFGTENIFVYNIRFAAQGERTIPPHPPE